MKPLADESAKSYPDWGYEELIQSMEIEIIHQADIGDYQGDTFAVVRDGDRYGYLSYGWGSCTGCDAAAACSTVAEATELRDQIWNGIRWEDSAAALLAWMDGKDWSLDWEWSEDRFQKFISEAKEQLVRIVRGEQPVSAPGSAAVQGGEVA